MWLNLCPFSVCESRKYTYFFPTYLLIPPKPGSGLHKIWAEHSSKFTGTTSGPTADPAQTFWEGKELNTKEEDLAIKRSWRVHQDQVETIRKLAARYEGTHNFHNFTVGRDFTDRSNNRYMKKIEVSLVNPITVQFIYRCGRCPTQWCTEKLNGSASSSMARASCCTRCVYQPVFFSAKILIFNPVDCELHLIPHIILNLKLSKRKMMAILVLACRMGTPTRVISEVEFFLLPKSHQFLTKSISYMVNEMSSSQKCLHLVYSSKSPSLIHTTKE